MQPSLVSIFFIKNHNQKQLEEERVFLTSHSPSSGEPKQEFKAGTQRQKPGDRK